MRWISALFLLAGLAFGQTLVVKGDVAIPLTLKVADLASLPHEKVTITGSNGVKTEYDGVMLRDVLKKAGAPLSGQLRGSALTTYVLAMASDGYQAVFSLGELDETFGNEKILLAESQGAFRLICPDDKAGARSVRMLETLEVVRLKK